MALARRLAVILHRIWVDRMEDHPDHVLYTARDQADAVAWAKKNGHHPHVARVRHLNDKKKPDHWRQA